MKDKIFVDSNIFLYAFSDIDSNKQDKSVHIIEKDIIISTQVINEVSSNMLKKLKFSHTDISEFVSSCYRRYTVVNFTREIFILACDLREQYSLSYYDSLIVAAALNSSSTILYSEDMKHNLLINKQLKIINPFFIKTKSG